MPSCRIATTSSRVGPNVARRSRCSSGSRSSGVGQVGVSAAASRAASAGESAEPGGAQTLRHGVRSTPRTAGGSDGAGEQGDSAAETTGDHGPRAQAGQDPAPAHRPVDLRGIARLTGLRPRPRSRPTRLTRRCRNAVRSCGPKPCMCSTCAADGSNPRPRAGSRLGKMRSIIGASAAALARRSAMDCTLVLGTDRLNHRHLKLVFGRAAVAWLRSGVRLHRLLYEGIRRRGRRDRTRPPERRFTTPRGTAATTTAPSFLARHPSRPVLYCVNEVAEGAISAWRVGADGSLDPLGTWSTQGSLPCYLAVGSSGRHVFVANYGSGSLAAFPLDPDGVPGAASDVIAHSGRGPHPERQDGPHVHMAVPDDAAHRVLTVDLGLDSVYGHRLDPTTGRVERGDVVLRTRPGTGPRHFVRDRRGVVYLVGELDASVSSFVDSGSGLTRSPTSRPARSRMACRRRSPCRPTSACSTSPTVGRTRYPCSRWTVVE